MRSRFIATLTGALLISGCAPALQNAPRGASVAAPIAWRTQLGVPAPVEAQWWQRFGDPQMSALVEKARANNPDVRIAAARVEQARATERGSRGLLLPSLGIGVDGAVRREVSPSAKDWNQSVCNRHFAPATSLISLARMPRRSTRPAPALPRARPVKR